ncbi:MAG: MFS transporter [Planctomycetota bacterium]|nr:MFS transporter [Planctomycetota bacterium]
MPAENLKHPPATPSDAGLEHAADGLRGIAHGKTIILAGCLGMAYTQLTLCPAGIEFARHFGGTGLHIGILGAIPTGMLFLQFLSAVVANHLTHRRGLWMTVSIVQRLILLPVALGPVFLPGVSPTVWLWSFLGFSALNHGLLHFATPLWMSWMGDYLPRSRLSRFWGVRHLWMQWSGAASLLFASYLLQSYTDEIQTAFSILIVVAAVFGVADILLFLPVYEPPVTKIAETRIRKVLAEPFRNRDFRSFISFMSFWHFAAMVGAPFISLFLLAEVGMSLSRVLLLWVFCWVGGAACSARIGRLTERFGHRPILILCALLKSSNMLALILVPNDPEIAFPILVPVFILDSILNAGFVVATNGFMLTKSPSGNRTMFIAAGTALAGLVGGITSVVCGGLLTWFSLETVVFGIHLSSYRMLFLVSIVLRIASLLLVVRIRESDSHGTRHVVSQLIGATPLRLIHFPVGLFRSNAPDHDSEMTEAREDA